MLPFGAINRRDLIHYLKDLGLMGLIQVVNINTC